MNEKTVEINGTIYDKITGMPIRRTDAAPQQQRAHAKVVHRTPQKSTTLHRQYVQKHKPAARQAAVAAPAPVKAARTIHVTDAATVRTPTVSRSPMIQKYAKHPVSPAPKKQPVMRDVLAPPAVHPMVQQVHAAKAAKSTPVSRAPKPSDIIKKEAIESALQNAPSHNRAPRREKASKAARVKKQRFGRAFSFATSGAALLLIAGYFTYINMPSLSVRVAAVQAGIRADYPGYRPTGYSLAGPIAFDNGSVAMTFDANGSGRNFTLTQTKSGWDSAAVYENYVAERTNNNSYTTTTSGGLTIYSWNGNAAWVNNGILYTINGDAMLTPDQIQRMATSL